VQYLLGSDKAQHVQEMFSRLSPHYDLMNRLMTAGLDIRWRQEVIQRLNLPRNSLILDLGAGTGDLALEAQRMHPDCRPVAADFTREMLLVGKAKDKGAALDWLVSDALCLPFPADTFIAVVSGFLLRNVNNIDYALNEQYRVLKPGGRIVILDTTRPARTFFSPLTHFYLHKVIPFMGSIISGQRKAYTYLTSSTELFLLAEQLAAKLAMTGFKCVGFRRLMLGTVAIHWGKKPETQGFKYLSSQLIGEVDAHFQ
jgi:demethylmenaquinone methyltransferase / 2-methoxy-6-polyprenyl-1,4-benzoquinol methylase